MPQLAKKNTTPPIWFCSCFPSGTWTHVAKGSFCCSRCPSRGLFSSLSPFSSSQTAYFIHVPSLCKDGGHKHGESLTTKTGCLEHPQYAWFCAEHLIYCFICPHRYPHFTDEEVEAQRGKGTCPRSHRWYEKKLELNPVL